MPGVSGVTVVTNARAYYHYTRGCGRIERPAFPAPLLGQRRALFSKRAEHCLANFARNRRRDREAMLGARKDAQKAAAATVAAAATFDAQMTVSN